MSKQPHQLHLYQFTIPNLELQEHSTASKTASIRRTNHNASKIQTSINLIKTFFCLVQILVKPKLLVY